MKTSINSFLTRCPIRFISSIEQTSAHPDCQADLPAYFTLQIWAANNSSVQILPHYRIIMPKTPPIVRAANS